VTYACGGLEEQNMTETEWMACTDPDKMLAFVEKKASSRKARLFSVACCRRIWSLLQDFRSRRAVEVAESFADGEATELALQLEMSESVDGWEGKDGAAVWAAAACIHVTDADALAGAIWTSRCAAASFADDRWRDAVDAAPTCGQGIVDWVMAEPPRESKAWAERKEQSDLLRDLFALLPFRPVAVETSWLTWNGGTAVKLAQSIYHDRAFDCLPVLADALEEAGCQDPAILGHCRHPGVHVRGCWLIDLLTGRE
jgi:hypothetical protein